MISLFHSSWSLDCCLGWGAGSPPDHGVEKHSNFFKGVCGLLCPVEGETLLLYPFRFSA